MLTQLFLLTLNTTNTQYTIDEQEGQRAALVRLPQASAADEDRRAQSHPARAASGQRQLQKSRRKSGTAQSRCPSLFECICD